MVSSADFLSDKREETMEKILIKFVRDVRKEGEKTICTSVWLSLNREVLNRPCFNTWWGHSCCKLLFRIRSNMQQHAAVFTVTSNYMQIFTTPLFLHWVLFIIWSYRVVKTMRRIFFQDFFALGIVVFLDCESTEVHKVQRDQPLKEGNLVSRATR